MVVLHGIDFNEQGTLVTVYPAYRHCRDLILNPVFVACGEAETGNATTTILPSEDREMQNKAILLQP